MTDEALAEHLRECWNDIRHVGIELQARNIVVDFRQSGYSSSNWINPVGEVSISITSTVVKKL